MTDIAAKADRPSIMTFVKANIRDYALLLSLAAIMVYFQIATDGILFTPLNMTNIILQNSYIVIMALGMLLIIVAGHIDLSVGFLSGFIGAIAGVLMVNNPLWPAALKMGTVPAVIICLIVGTAIGAFQGWFVARFRIPAFIVTLAGMLVYRGLMIAMLSGRNLGPSRKASRPSPTATCRTCSPSWRPPASTCSPWWWARSSPSSSSGRTGAPACWNRPMAWRRNRSNSSMRAMS